MMDATRTSALCDRIDEAFARIDAAVALRRPAADLQRRHEALRQAATNSLAVIDALITSHEAGHEAAQDAGQ